MLAGPNSRDQVVPQFEFEPIVKMTNSRHHCHMAKRPRDPAQLARQVFDIAIGEAEDTVSESKRHPSGHQVSGKKGGPARAKSLSAEQRRQIAMKAAQARWKNRRDG